MLNEGLGLGVVQGREGSFCGNILYQGPCAESHLESHLIRPSQTSKERVQSNWSWGLLEFPTFPCYSTASEHKPCNAHGTIHKVDLELGIPLFA